MKKERFGVSILFFICGLNFASWATRIPDYKVSLHLTDAELGRVLLGLPIGSLVSLPIAGWLLTKYRSKLISLLAVIFYIVVMPLIGLTTSQVSLFVTLFGFGMAGDILNIAMNTQVVGIENKLNKVVMSSFHAVFSLGLMFGSFIGGFLSKNDINPFQHFVAISIVNVISIPVFYRLLMNEDIKVEQKSEKTSVFSLSPYLITLSIIALCGMLCEGAMADWITLYFKEYALENPFPTTIGFSAFALAMVVGRFSGDYLTIRLGLKNMLVLSGILLSAGIFILLIFSSVYLKITGCFITGVGIATIVPLVYSAAGNSGDLPPSVAIAGVSTIAYAGFLTGPVLIGYLSDLIGLPMALILLIILGICATLISQYSLRISKN